ncbi:MAG: right-handed parallel beta-helix repeat-containing protein [Verrucomicrobia bacterium]|nr:right-handed parallel beta-helix repeat-containing protein [Verrucomicrobiota bacterium]
MKSLARFIAAVLATAVRSEPTAVTTFECIGLYYPSAETGVCNVHYRAAGTSAWRPALDLVYDPRNQEYRGSIIGLQPDTAHEVRLTHRGRSALIGTRTGSDRFPVGKTTRVASQTVPFAIMESGTPAAYHLITPHPQTRTTIDVANQADHTFVIDADYVIVRGLELKNAAQHGVLIKPGRHHVVVEDCRITGWGRGGGSLTFGNTGNMDSGIYAGPGAGHLVLQRNLIENPRGAANDWDSGHPAGPQGISLINSTGHNVIRYNEIVSTDDRGFNDGIGGGANNSTAGSPNRDSDIHGNIIAGVWDDGIESEGANMNVRIWGNYIDRAFVHVATASTSKGPLYIHRNVFGVSRRTRKDPMGVAMIKTGMSGEFGRGHKFVFHNTALQPRGAFSVFSGHPDVPDPNTVTRNNIFDCPGRLTPSLPDTSSDYDYDFYSGSDRGRATESIVRSGRIGWPTGVQSPDGSRTIEPHGVSGAMAYLPSYSLEFYPAAVTTRVEPGRTSVDRGGKAVAVHGAVVTVPNPVIDGGTRLPNFNDDFSGGAPDIGAFEVGRPPLRFGRRAVDNTWAPWELYAHES